MIDSILARGSMMSWTVMLPRSKRFTRIERCFFGMNWPDSSTSVRIATLNDLTAEWTGGIFDATGAGPMGKPFVYDQSNVAQFAKIF